MDPLTQPQFAPAPESPAPVPGFSGDPTQAGLPQGAGQTLSPEEMKAKLEELMARVQEKYQEFGAQKFSSDDKIKQLTDKILREFFDLLEQQGVDPRDVEAVNALLEKIRANNPEAYTQIQMAMRVLLGEDTEAPQGGQPMGAPMMGAPMVGGQGVMGGGQEPGGQPMGAPQEELPVEGTPGELRG